MLQADLKTLTGSLILYSFESYEFHEISMSFVADEEFNILPSTNKKNQLHEALENERFKDASRLITSSSEADLVECFESLERSYKSCLLYTSPSPRD